MDDKPTAGVVTAIIIAPLVALCCLGPVFIGSAMGAAKQPIAFHVSGSVSNNGLAITWRILGIPTELWKNNGMLSGLVA